MPDGGGDKAALPVGSFGAWLGDMTAALRGERDADVPCGTCTACCTASQFVHIGPEETDALAVVPAELQFPAPGLPQGHVIMGYDERGHCPMLVDGACSIYEHRPRTCRTYDCRILAAAGVDVAPDGQPEIARQAARWRFDTSAEDDAVLHDAVRAAAAYVTAHRADLAHDVAPSNATQLAVVAVSVHDAFVDASGTRVVAEPDREDVEAAARRGPPRQLER